MITRRMMVGGLAAGAGTLLTGCDALGESESFRRGLMVAEGLNKAAHRLITDRGALAREFSAADLSPIFRSNGTSMPISPVYQAMAARGFTDWRLTLDGMVTRPQRLSLADIRAMPARTQITRHDCVEGWSAIGKWTGVPLRLLLQRAGIGSNARYIVFHCSDDSGGGELYYESIDMIDAMHPQTIMAWALNDRTLPIANGAPLRLRVERQLGYKHAKYVERIEAVSSLTNLRGGKGGFWEDHSGYEWYAGI